MKQKPASGSRCVFTPKSFSIFSKAAHKEIISVRVDVTFWLGRFGAKFYCDRDSKLMQETTDNNSVAFRSSNRPLLIDSVSNKSDSA